MGICRTVVVGKPAHELAEAVVEHLHGVLVLVVLAVCKVNHGRQVCPVQLVVGRLYQQLCVCVDGVVVGDDLLARPEEHFRLHHAFHFVEPLCLRLVGEGVGLDVIHFCDDAGYRCHRFPSSFPDDMETGQRHRAAALRW